MGKYRSAIASGVSWMGALRLANRGLGLVRIAVLARILSPAQFGIFGIATLILGFLEIATETGVNVILIQEKERFANYISSAWVVSIARGIIISLLIVLLAPIIVGFFETPSAITILLLISLTPLIRGFINPAVVKFQKDLEFNKEFFKSFSLFLVETIAAIILAISMRSENSLAIAMIISAVVEVVISFVFIRPLPQLKFEKEKVKEVISAGKWVAGAGIFDYLFHHLDDVIVGKLLGPVALGLYQQAYKLSSLAVTEAGEVFNKVMFPVYTEASVEKPKLRKIFLSTAYLVPLLVIPFGFVLIFFSRQIIGIIYGEQWAGAAAVLPLLAVYGVLRAISNSTNPVFLAMKMQKVITLTTFVSILVLAITVIPLINLYGMNGAAYATILAALSAFPPSIYYLHKALRV